MAFLRVRTINGGTFTAGISADWSTQFDDPTKTVYGPSAIFSQAGEVNFPTTTTIGVCVDYAFWMNSPCDIQFWVQAGVGTEVQVNINGSIQELNAAGIVTVSTVGGPNVLRFIKAVGPLTAILATGMPFGSQNSFWMSLYPAGADPFLQNTIGPGSGGGTTGIGSTGAGGTV